MALTRCTTSAIARVAGLIFAVGASAEEWSHRGLLRSRDLSPFGLLRLDIASAGMLPLSPGQSAVELQLSYQNTFVLSKNVESYLRERDVGRSALRPEDAVVPVRAIHRTEPAEVFRPQCELPFFGSHT